MPDLTTPAVPVSRVGPELWLEVVELLHRDLPPDVRADQTQAILAAAAGGQASLDGLFAVFSGQRPVGAVLVEIQPGRTAVVAPPRAAEDAPPAARVALLSQAVRYAASCGVHFVQALTAPEAIQDIVDLRAAGFRHVADLLYLVSLQSDFPAAAPTQRLVFEPYTTADEARLMRLVERTYAATLDCPQLNGRRDVGDVLAGYRAVGDRDAGSWWIVRSADELRGEDLGCLLLADHSAAGHFELVYMGIVPEARGRGFGLDITRQAQWLTRQSGRRRLVLAVDEANAPAVAMYAAAGFRQWDRRSAFVKD